MGVQWQWRGMACCFADWIALCEPRCRRARLGLAGSARRDLAASRDPAACLFRRFGATGIGSRPAEACDSFSCLSWRLAFFDRRRMEPAAGRVASLIRCPLPSGRVHLDANSPLKVVGLVAHCVR